MTTINRYLEKTRVGKIRTRNRDYFNEANPCWKGDKVGYFGIHDWLRVNFGKAYKCENYGCTRISKRFEWAKKRGYDYARNRNHFIQLCKSCHTKYDMTDEWRNKNRARLIGTKQSKETKEKRAATRSKSIKRKAF